MLSTGLAQEYNMARIWVWPHSYVDEQTHSEPTDLSYTIFLYVDEGLPADRHAWLQRRAAVAKRLEESSLVTRLDLEAQNMTLQGTFALDEANYLAKGGAIPIFVRGAGMVAVITVSGLHDVEDHEIIIAVKPPRRAPPELSFCVRVRKERGVLSPISGPFFVSRPVGEVWSMVTAWLPEFASSSLGAPPRLASRPGRW